MRNDGGISCKSFELSTNISSNLSWEITCKFAEVPESLLPEGPIFLKFLMRKVLQALQPVRLIEI